MSKSLKDILYDILLTAEGIKEDTGESNLFLLITPEVLETATAQLKALIIAQAPPIQKDNVKFYSENKKKGWTQEQLTERIWGYNKAREDYIKAIERIT